MSAVIESKIKELNNKYFAQIRRILMNKAYIFLNFREADFKEDTEDGFDAVLSFKDIKIPIRIREEQYLKFNDFTVRSISRCRQRTEIDKLKDGFGDFYFYAWSDESMFKKTGNKIISYMILDLNIFRQTIIDKPDVANRKNGDGTAFHAYYKKSLEANRIIKISETF